MSTVHPESVEMINTNKLHLKSVQELSLEKFHVPYYQRGYRWKEQQVRQLLDDLLSFNKTAVVLHYFLQVLVRAWDTGNTCWHVVDGQQRLTTINLVMRQFGMPRLELTYDREAMGSLDKHFMAEAERVIQAWLGEHSSEQKVRLKNNLLAACFLVYDLSEENNEIEVFSRINSGKIVAKDSELVKCVMLTPQTDEAMEITARRASEWDEMERTLNDEAFFAFLTPRNAQNADDRMTRVFIAAGFCPCEKTRNAETFPFLAVIQNEIKNHSRQDVWKKLTGAYARLQLWYRDNTAYHAIGWWIHRQRDGLAELFSVNDVLKELQKTLDEFENVRNDETLYESNSSGAHRILFLFNIAYAWGRQNCRYDFSRHRQVASWSLEHLMARNVAKLDEQTFEKYRKCSMMTEAKDFSWQAYQESDDNKKYLHEMLGDLYPPYDDHALGNLALLGTDANASLNNHLFWQKREQINAWCGIEGYFVPPATAAIFNKCFPDMEMTTPFLSKEDKEAYTDFIQKTIEDFVKEVKNHEN